MKARLNSAGGAPRARTVPCRVGRRAAALAAGAALALSTALPAQALPNPWMDPTLVVVQTTFDLRRDPNLLQTLGTIEDQLGPRFIYLLRPLNRTGSELVDVLGGPAYASRFPLATLNQTVSVPEGHGVTFDSIGNSVTAIGTAETEAARRAGIPVNWTTSWLSAPKLSGKPDGTGVTVAVLDTGFDLRHAWLSRRMTPGYDFVAPDDTPAEQGVPAPKGPPPKGYGHGTHVAGIVGTMAPGARIMPLRVLDGRGVGTLWTVSKGLVHAVDPDRKPASRDGARVLNMSFGSNALSLDARAVLASVLKAVTCHAQMVSAQVPFDHGDFASDRVRCSDPMQRPVAVAGEGNSKRAAVLYPAAFSVDAASMPALIPVTASTARGHLAGWATTGAYGQVVAPGEYITSAYPTEARGNTAIMSGTSMAAPWVAGVAARLMPASPPIAWSAASVANRIRKTTADLCGGGPGELSPWKALANDASDLTACR